MIILLKLGLIKKTLVIFNNNYNFLLIINLLLAILFFINQHFTRSESNEKNYFRFSIVDPNWIRS